MAWQSGAAGGGPGGMQMGDNTGIQAYTLQGPKYSGVLIRAHL